MESHSDSSFNTVSNSYSAYGNLVYLRGTGFTPGTNYRIAYYDAGADGGQWLKTTDTTSTALGELTDNTLLPGNFGSATANSWKALICDTGYDPAATYDAFTASEKIAEDTFTVAASAIPEFPTAMAGFAVVIMCFGLYYWMRKRRLQQSVVGSPKY